MNSSGKVLIIFLAISAILLVSLTAVSLYFVHLETGKRKLAETTLEQLREEQAKIDEELKALEKQNTVLQEKNKEAESRVIDLSDDLELEKGLKEELKTEALALQEKIAELEKLQEEHAAEIEKNEKKYVKVRKELSKTKKTVTDLESRLAVEMENSKKIRELYEQKQQEQANKEEELKAAQLKEEEVSRAQAALPPSAPDPEEIELEEIVIAPKVPAFEEPAPVLDEPMGIFARELDGKILSVDKETEFVIINLGEEDGLTLGNILSVYRNEDYVGDIKITRLQSEMSAADLVLPLSIKNIRKDDQVKVK